MFLKRYPQFSISAWGRDARRSEAQFSTKKNGPKTLFLDSLDIWVALDAGYEYA